jgi:hypothetical protein
MPRISQAMLVTWLVTTVELQQIIASSCRSLKKKDRKLNATETSRCKRKERSASNTKNASNANW